MNNFIKDNEKKKPYRNCETLAALKLIDYDYISGSVNEIYVERRSWEEGFYTNELEIFISKKRKHLNVYVKKILVIRKLNWKKK